jgi:defect-in-organelle-trafficking protein DotA
MKKILTVLFCLFCPVLAFADNPASFFTPPSTDYSVIFLGNLFGIVDGVLHGTGSQIMGKMFLVFNSAVLGLGGIVVTYTLIVGTMNTSHEGQFLGQKWSSIWIPIRSTIGLALLIPKASGYCLMQIFIMWVVVQGVGAADKVWDAALDYLNLGGVFVAAQSTLNPSTSNNTDLEKLAKGESAIMQGQVCMRGVQVVLETARTNELNAKQHNSGKCMDNNSDSQWQYFCANAVPDFVTTVNAVEAGDLGKTEVSMPNFTDGSMYQELNGICGKIVWSKLDMASETSNLDYVSTSDIDTLNSSRTIAIQQMYVDLISTSASMVTNDPELTTKTNVDATTFYSAIAQYQYGAPYLINSETNCTTPDSNCQAWHALSSGKTQTFIFSGFEFINSLSDYNSIMAPVLNLEVQNDNATANNKAHSFVSDAHATGWIMSGAYFFDMVALNGTAAGKGTVLVDSTSGLEGSTAYVGTVLTTPFSNSCNGSYGLLCKLLKGDVKPVNAIDNLITGTSVQSGLTPVVTAAGHSSVLTVGSASTYGYITNASLVNLPGQPGLSTPQFKFNLNLVPGQNLLDIPHVNFACGKVPFLGCVGRLLGDVIWNTMIKQFLGIFIDFISSLFDYVIENLLILPLTTIMHILNTAVQLLNTSQTHPIVALAYMGTAFINYCTSLYFQLIALSAIFAVGGGILLVFILPFLGCWMAVMLTIGFLDAYYVPFLPYMIFTFGTIAWFLAVIEAMVAGPIVGLGITHPEGHDALGKAEAAIMILINVFLRPALMVLGYIAAITLSYVAVYVVNSGFGHFMSFFMPPSSGAYDNPVNAISNMGVSSTDVADINSSINAVTHDADTAGMSGTATFDAYGNVTGYDVKDTSTTNSGSSWTAGASDAANAYIAQSGGTPYTNYASMFAGFFCLLVYTMIYLTVVEKAFTLIYLLPDQTLRWIGGQPEQFGKETAQWMDATKAKVEKGGEETTKASEKTSKDLVDSLGKMASKGAPPGGKVEGQ